MNTSTKRETVKWMMVALSLTLIVGCSSAKPSTQPNPASPATPSSPSPSVTQTTDATKELLLNMRQLAEQGRVINSTFPVKTTVIEDVKSIWGEPDKIEWSQLLKGTMLPIQTVL